MFIFVNIAIKLFKKFLSSLDTYFFVNLQIRNLQKKPTDKQFKC